MKIKIGHEHEVIGIIQLKDGKLSASGNLPILKHLVQHLKGDMPVTQFMETLPNRLRGYVWAKQID